MDKKVEKRAPLEKKIMAIQQRLSKLEPAALAEQLQNALEELRVAEEELHQQYDELLSTQAELAAEHQRYLDLFELAPCGYLVTDQTGVIRKANQTAVALLN